FSSTSDVDVFSFSATQGTSYIFWCDSVPNPLYQMRVFCSDQVTRLAFSGDLSAPAGGAAFIVWTAPVNGTYYLRMSFLAASGSAIGGYRIETGVDAPSPGDRARDQRDAFVAWSDDAASWTPSRINDEPPGFDDWLPEVAVASDGFPYGMWFDWRDAVSN